MNDTGWKHHGVWIAGNIAQANRPPLKNLYKKFDLYTFESMMKLCCTDLRACTGFDSEVLDAHIPRQAKNRHQRLSIGI